MKILLAPDKFKGSLTAQAACEAMQSGIHRFDPRLETVLHPLADGGEGTLKALGKVLDLETVWLTVNGPLFRPTQAFYKKNEHTAFIEMALASGLSLLDPHERNCLHTTTYGTGKLVLDAMHRGVHEIFLFAGGSATNDAGVGMAAALGFVFLDKKGRHIRPIGLALRDLHAIQMPKHIDWQHALHEVNFHVVCDVTNPLFGPHGAAEVYAPQKGANPIAVRILDDGLQNFAEVVQRDLGKNVAELPGAGAAGGLGAGAVAFLGADILPGIETVMRVTHFHEKLPGTDLILTGEGKLDAQTLAGKVVAGVANAGRKAGIPVGLICGKLAVGEADLEKLGIGVWAQVHSDGIPVEQAMAEAGERVAQLAFEMVSHWRPSAGPAPTERILPSKYGR